MWTVLVAVIARVIVDICRAVRRMRQANIPRPLCTGCSHAHVQYAANGRRAIACTYGGGVRSMVLDVMYCTDYHDRNAVPQLVSIGFVRPVADADVMAAVRT